MPHKFYHVTAEQIQMWKEIYPAVDVMLTAPQSLDESAVRKQVAGVMTNEPLSNS